MNSLKSFAKKLGIMVLSTLGFVVVADLVGVAGSFFCDTFMSERRTSVALYYAIWFVDGVFCGMLHYMTTGNVITPQGKGSLMQWPDKGETGRLAILTTSVVLAGLAFFFYKHDWQYPRADSVYVPDSEGLTLTFFITILAMMIFMHRNMGPTNTTPRKKKK